jgi:hypothetical protein
MLTVRVVFVIYSDVMIWKIYFFLVAPWRCEARRSLVLRRLAVDLFHTFVYHRAELQLDDLNLVLTFDCGSH